MTGRIFLLLFLLGLGTVSAVAYFQESPGYMDADYYYAGGLRLATGYGFTEPFLWNYLDDPAGLPHPSHAYWMPLASILAAAGMKLSGMVNFSGARLGFLLVAALLPPLTAALSCSLTGRRDLALLSGLFAAFPAYYLTYLGTTDNFGVYMLLGGLWFLAAGSWGRIRTGYRPLSRLKQQPAAIFLPPLWLGLIAGCMHLARSDGALWLLVSIAANVILSFDRRMKLTDLHNTCSGERRVLCQAKDLVKRDWQFLLLSTLAVLLGYLLVMGPWMARNLAVFGAPLAPGGGRALWLTRYDELYAYPASILTPDRWWESGIEEILRARGAALGQNLLQAFASQGSIFLAPLILLGMWRLRRDFRVLLGALAWLLTLFVMTVIFPHQGWRGGFFHSGAALQPLFWAAAPVGLEAFVEWGVRRRGWQRRQAMAVFSTGLVGLAVLLAAFVVQQRVIGGDLARPAWSGSDVNYRGMEAELLKLGAGPGEILAVNNPAGYSIAAGRPAIAIPDGPEKSLLAAARRYGVRYVLLEPNHPRGLDELYSHPQDRPGLDYLVTVEGAHIFRLR